MSDNLNESNKITYIMTQAMNTGQTDLMDSLVTLGLNTNFKDGSGGTLMHMAVSIGGGNTATMKWLKEHNVGVNEQNNDGDLPIHLAAGYGYLEAVKWLLDNGVDVNAKGINNRTPMHQAAGTGKIEVMRYLKERGADLYARDDTGSSPMDSAIVCNQIESIKCLASLGYDVNARDSYGATPIFQAVQADSIENIKCLVSLGADVNAKDNYGATPIFQAVQADSIENIKCLVSLGADVNARDNDGATALILAAFIGKFECLKCLADLGADVKAKAKNGVTPIDAASMGSHSEIVEWLILKFIADFTEKIQLDPGNSELYVNRGVLYTQREDFNLAINDFNEALRLNPENAKAYECRGVVYSQRKDYDQAIADFTKAILLDTNCKNAYKMRGAAYGIKEEHDKSIADYEKALLIDPNDNSIAIALENAKKLKKEAEELIKKKKKWQFLTILSVVLGGIIGGFVFAFLDSVITATSNSSINKLMAALAVVFGILFWIKRSVGFGCLGAIIGVVAGVVLSFLLASLPFMASIAIGIIAGALIGLYCVLSNNEMKRLFSDYEMKRRFWIAFGIAMGVIVIGLALFFLTTPIPDHTLISEEVSQNDSFSEEIGIDMVFVKGGTFAMGCTQEQGIDCSSGDKPVRSVTVNDFQIGKYEVTQSQWIQVMGSNPSAFEGDNLPVEKVSWNDAQEFISKLNSITNKNYRLPTEAEWEYAARGGAKSKGHKYAGSNNIDEISWHKDNSGNRTHPVGTKQANELGIYDMSGNVWEWVNNASSQELSSDSVVERGGSWNRPANRGQVSYRSKDSPNHRCYADGFRLAMSVQNTGSVTPGKYPQAERLLTDSDLRNLSKKDLNRLSINRKIKAVFGLMEPPVFSPFFSAQCRNEHLTRFLLEKRQ